MIFDGNQITCEATDKLEIDLIALVAETSIWVANTEGISNPVYPNVRRGTKKLTRGQLDENHNKIDDNSYANLAIKKHLKAHGIFKNFAVCHIWPKTCYDPRYHTALCNLILLPRALAGLTDHNEDVIQCVQYRAWELYQWHPENTPKPSKPNKYPSNWKPGLEKISIEKNKKYKTRQTEPIPLFIIPDEGKFRENLKKHNEAFVYLYTKEDLSERVEKTWKAKNFNPESNLANNIRSRSDVRSGQVDGKKIYRIEIKAK